MPRMRWSTRSSLRYRSELLKERAAGHAGEQLCYQGVRKESIARGNGETPLAFPGGSRGRGHVSFTLAAFAAGWIDSTLAVSDRSRDSMPSVRIACASLVTVSQPQRAGARYRLGC
jgi:hypothetical protein